MVEVSLFDLLQVRDSRRAWPSEFAAMVEACEKDRSDRLPFGVVADWCDEHGEESLGSAFRWLHKRPTVAIVDKHYGSALGLENAPASVRSVESDGLGLVGLICSLAERLEQLREDLA